MTFLNIKWIKIVRKKKYGEHHIGLIKFTIPILKGNALLIKDIKNKLI